MTNDDPPDITEESAIETAFTQSGSHEFNGFELEPWTPARIVASQAMGLHYGSVDEAGRSRFATDKVYPGAQRDVAIVLWLCTLKTEKEVDAAARAPAAAMPKVYAFAGDHKLTDTGSENFWKGFLVFLEMMNQVAASRVNAEKKTTPDNQPIPQTI
jgi:hypothetical protein